MRLTLAMRLPKYSSRRFFSFAIAGLGGLLFSCWARAASSPPHGLEARPPAKAYLQMPPNADGPIPRQLSETGAFKDLPKLIPADGLIPYDLVVPFWSDHAAKLRWISVPTGQTIQFSPTGEWVFPEGTVFVKTFEIGTDEAKPDVKRRLETRLLVRDDSGGVYGVTYKWRPDNSDADLLESNLTETLVTKIADGERTQSWYYPNRKDCLTCHTANAGFVLGVKARQLNRDFVYRSGVTDNELRAWNHLGLFQARLNEADLANSPKLARLDDLSRSLEDRARSYLDANCAHCHRPTGTVAGFDARYDTPLAKQSLVGGRVLIDEGIDHARIVAPNDIWRSILYLRANSVEAFKMPPLGRNTIDPQGTTLLRAWIESLPGPPVLPPPEIFPHGGTFARAVTVRLKSEQGAAIHYTLDGSAPSPSDPTYGQPLQLTGPTILRARAFKAGFTSSIPTQEIFIVGE
ncbi:MAG: hypothetical protein EXS38_05390 [Opitutus sp.]|nr:hypothetical protein [Opitutus sp.]